MSELAGWGRYPRLQGELVQPAARSRFAAALADGSPAIARGLGRSYGDSSLGPRVIGTSRIDHFLAFDSQSGMLECEAGVSLAEVLRMAVPRGWFLPVTPGTRFVTVGGAIASDVHGKNHHRDGTFGDHVRSVDLLTGDGECVTASRTGNADLFHATCGGMGLTGVILSAAIQLMRIASSDILETTVKAASLDELLAAFDAHASSRYSVAWIDCMASGAKLGRGLLMLGEHAADGELRDGHAGSRRVPVDMPGGFLNPFTARTFNTLYHGRVRRAGRTRRIPFQPFFYPLDRLEDWNRLYGKGGFVQYQFVLPEAAGRGVLRELLQQIAASGQGSYLAVLKQFGPSNDNLLSFPVQGWTLALDFKAEPAVFALLDRLDDVVTRNGGRIYLAKDARMSASTFKRGYPQWEQFEAVRERWHAHGRFASAQSKRLGLQ